MQQIWCDTVKDRLKQMDKLMAADFRMKAGNALEFAPANLAEDDEKIRPALVFLMTDVFSGDQEKAVIVAGVIQFIHLATKIHNNIGDQEDKFAPRFPVLIGDYLYSKFFAYLSKYNLLEFLAPLAETICKIHTGGVIRKEILETQRGTGHDFEKALTYEQGLLMGEACRMVAVLSNASYEMQKTAAEFGTRLGEAWGLIQLNSGDAFVQEAMSKVKLLMPKLPQGLANDALNDLIQKFDNYTCKNDINMITS